MGATEADLGDLCRLLATGIISTGTFLLGPSWLSRALLGAASAGLIVLGAALTARPARVLPDRQRGR